MEVPCGQKKSLTGSYRENILTVLDKLILNLYDTCKRELLGGVDVCYYIHSFCLHPKAY